MCGHNIKWIKAVGDSEWQGIVISLIIFLPNTYAFIAEKPVKDTYRNIFKGIFSIILSSAKLLGLLGLHEPQEAGILKCSW